jgi:uncharacterized protein YdeI (YjbR/CyaY-like superfamily)
MTPDEDGAVAFPTAAAWRAWLADHHADASGIWLMFAKTTGAQATGAQATGAQATGAQATLSYAEALDEAICFGWIDAQTRGLNAGYWLKRFTPRKPGSRWSKINTQKADALIAAGRMASAGLAEVDRARADGRWESAYAGSRTMSVPDDLQAALDASAEAAAFFARLSSQNRYAILYRIATVKRPETRARKIAQYVRMLEEHQTLH